MVDLAHVPRNMRAIDLLRKERFQIDASTLSYYLFYDTTINFKAKREYVTVTMPLKLHNHVPQYNYTYS